jgi:hypothetical protein
MVAGMNAAQRTAAVQYLGEGAAFVEVWAMVGASRRDAELEYTTGKRDAENGIESELSAWYLEAAAARARVRATLRAEARESSGSREATDNLAVLSALLAEEEPTALASSDVRADSPILSIIDKIEDAATPPEERARLRGIQQRAELGLHELFVEMTRPKGIGVDA